MNAVQYGNGAPLVLLHGLFGDKDNLKVLARTLSDHYTCHCIDLPNHGQSGHIDSMKFADLAEPVLDYLKHVYASSNQPIHLIGHSLGGKLAMLLATQNSELIRSLVVLDIAPTHNSNRFEVFINAMQTLPLDEIASRSHAQRHLVDRTQDPLISAFLLKSMKRSDKGWGWAFNLNAIAESEDWLENPLSANSLFAGRVLFIAGALSDYITDADSVTIHKHFPQANIDYIVGAGHWVHADKPQECVQRIQAFYKTIE